MQVTFTIGEVAELLGITPKTIRHYHKIGLLTDPIRDTNNYRYYTITQIEELQEILKLKSYGLSLKQIKLIINADHADNLTQAVLKEHERNIKREILQLQHQLDNVQAYLSNSPQTRVQPTSLQASTSSIFSDSVKFFSNGLSDILMEIEGHLFDKMDDYPRELGYEEFVHQTGRTLAEHIMQEETLYIFWMERFASLATMSDGDLQGKAWLDELNRSSARKFIASTLQLPTYPDFPLSHQQHINKLLVALLQQNSNSLQKQFLMLLVQQ